MDCQFGYIRLSIVVVLTLCVGISKAAVHSFNQELTTASQTTTETSVTPTTVNETSNLKAAENNFVESNNSVIRHVRFETLSAVSNIQNTTTAAPVEDSYKLPDLWKDFCEVNNGEFFESKFTNRTQLTTIRCDITLAHSGVWTMRDLRQSLSLYNDYNKAFAIELQCDYHSNISLSHPMQVINLYKISVKGCIIEDYFAEQLSKELETTPDSIRSMEFRDNVVVISVRNYMYTLKNVKHIKKEFDCAHDDTIEYMSNRNISYSFKMDVDPSEIEDLTMQGEQFMADVKRIDHKCNYRHLMVLDKGNTKSRSIYHMDLMTENSFYDELLVYNFSYNYIKALDDQQLKWSTRFPKLRLFDLSHNEISDIYMFKMPLHNTNRVTTINLQYNNISMLTVKDLQNFKDIPTMFIDIRNNPIDCNCSESMRELLKYIHRGEHLKISTLSDYSYIADLKCVWPLHVAGITLGELTEDMVCEVEVEYFLVPLVCMSVAIVVLCLLMFVGLRFRQEINIILFTRFNIIVPCHSRESFDSSKKYDAFVSYSSKEEEYVEKLFEDLEKPNESGTRFKFCLHHRDFVPGKSIFENVAVSVESSRHTIILLSNHFVKSEYCMHEFKEAFRQSIMEQKRHLVIIMMEDIDMERLPRDIKRCIKTFTYIRRDDYLFTERLIYALSVKQKSKIVKRKKVKSLDIESVSPKPSSRLEFVSNSSVNSINKSDNSKSSVSTGVSPSNKTTTEVKTDKQTVVVTSENDLNFNNKIQESHNENENPENTIILKTDSQKLEVNIKTPEEINTHYLEKKLSNEFDRSVSTDTGYGSERGSYCEKLSPEVC